MIVDVHNHTPTHEVSVPPKEVRVNDRWRPDRAVVTTNSWDDYDKAHACVDLSIAFNIAVTDPLADTGLAFDPTRVNESTAAFVRDAPEKRIGFMSINPISSDALVEMERCHEELGLVGIKLAPNYQNFDPLAKESERFFTLASQRGLPVLFHQGASPVRTAPLRYAHPLLIDELAIRYPSLRMVIAHLGHPWQRDAIITIRKHPNVFADVSAQFYRPWSFYEALLMASEWGVCRKLLLGSDYPLATPGETMAGLRNVNHVVEGTALPRVARSDVEGIINRDALSALGLRDPRNR